MKTNTRKNDKPRMSTPPSSRKSSEAFYASSAYFNSPDPSQLPLPVFDDDELPLFSKSSMPSANYISTDSVNSYESAQFELNRTQALKSFLNIRPGLTA